MGDIPDIAGPCRHERRRSRRLRVTCPATLCTLTGEFAGQLWDLSETGARFEGTKLPERDSKALLTWRDQKHACTVVWIHASMCGLEFEEPVSGAIVSECTRLLGTKEEPIAELSNIPLGKRRSAPADLPAFHAGNQLVRTTIVFLGKPKRGSILRSCPFLSPEEEMFFWGAPLAHLVAYQDFNSARAPDVDVRPGFTIFDKMHDE